MNIKVVARRAYTRVSPKYVHAMSSSRDEIVMGKIGFQSFLCIYIVFCQFHSIGPGWLVLKDLQQIQGEVLFNQKPPMVLFIILVWEICYYLFN